MTNILTAYSSVKYSVFNIIHLSKNFIFFVCRPIMEGKQTVLSSLLPVMTMTPLNWSVQPVPM